MGFDEVYGQIGQFGAYQRRVLIFLSIICMSAGFYAFFPVFGDTEPQAWFCRGTEDQTDKGMNEDEKCKLWSNGGCLPNYQAERESTVTEVCLLACSSVSLSVCLLACLPACLPACRLFVCLSVCVSAFVCLPVCIHFCVCLSGSVCLSW